MKAMTEAPKGIKDFVCVHAEILWATTSVSNCFVFVLLLLFCCAASPAYPLRSRPPSHSPCVPLIILQKVVDLSLSTCIRLIEMLTTTHQLLKSPPQGGPPLVPNFLEHKPAEFVYHYHNTKLAAPAIILNIADNGTVSGQVNRVTK